MGNADINLNITATERDIKLFYCSNSKYIIELYHTTYLIRTKARKANTFSIIFANRQSIKKASEHAKKKKLILAEQTISISFSKETQGMRPIMHLETEDSKLLFFKYIII